MKQESRPVHYHWKNFLLNILSPVVLAITLFNILIFAIVIPEMKENIIRKKHETIRELTRAELSEISYLHEQEQQGRLNRETAQQMALSRLESIRYGDENKDYFWVTDLQPKMIMHPYRRDLEGSDLQDYRDPKGKRLFVEAVRVVREKGEGRIDYLWQWKDDPEKIVPKVSFVKEFKPWGWIVGTGIYIEDVRTEVNQMTRKVINISLGISFLVALLLAYMIRGTLLLERQRSRAQAALLESEEKYRTLVESNTEGILLTIDGRPVFSNRALLEITGYSEAEIGLLTIDELMTPEKRLITKQGDIVDVIVSQTPIVLGGKNGSLISFKDVSKNRRDPDALVKLLNEIQSLALLSEAQIKTVQTRLVECGLDTSVQQAATMMTTAGTDAILIRAPSGEAVGIVTDRDLRKRVTAQALKPEATVASIMTAPLVKADQDTLMFEAAITMRENNIDHLIVTGESGKISGLLSIADIMQGQKHPASVILNGINSAKSFDDLAGTRDKVNALVAAMLENGARVDAATRIMSTITDATICRVVDLAVEKQGPAPSAFAFIVLGSEARREQTLRTDQDNGIIYTQTPGREDATFEYFINLGRIVSEELDVIGYQKCRGNVMGSNPKWCRPIEDWAEYFSRCVNAQTPQDLLDFNVFFDFRHIRGDSSLVNRLKDHLYRICQEHHAFFFNLAESTLKFKPPVGFFGNLQLESVGERPPAFNIKSAITPIVNFARIYALKHEIRECNTLQRLARLMEKGVLHPTSYEETLQGYTFLMRLRLVHQAAMLKSGQPPDNFLDLQTLTQLELSSIKKIFGDIVVLQAKLRNDFARTA